MTADITTKHIGGRYTGWVRPSNGEWEDMIGAVQVEYDPTVGQSVTIKSLEFGLWEGSVAKNGKSLRAETGQGKTFFQCSIGMESQSERVRTVLEGSIRESRFRKLFGIRLNGDWR